MRTQIFIGIGVFLLLSSCKKEKPEIIPPAATYATEIRVYPTFGSETLYLDSTYTTPENFEIRFGELKFFISQFKNGTNTLAEAAMFDYRTTQNEFIYTAKNGSLFPNLTGYLGVDSTLNHKDPSAFPSNSPLNIMNASDMHWSWNPGYIFVKIEAKVDTLADGIENFNHNVVFHVGMDEFIQTLDFQAIPWNINGNKHSAKLNFDLLQFLTNAGNPFSLKSEFISHAAAGQDALTLKVMQATKNALQFTP